MNHFKDDCNVCGAKDNTVWEILPGIALCEKHEEEWYVTGMNIHDWVVQKHALRMVGSDELVETI